jgi:hypothetical protein
VSVWGKVGSIEDQSAVPNRSTPGGGRVIGDLEEMLGTVPAAPKRTDWQASLPATLRRNSHEKGHLLHNPNLGRLGINNIGC